MQIANIFASSGSSHELGSAEGEVEGRRGVITAHVVGTKKPVS